MEATTELEELPVFPRYFRNSYFVLCQISETLVLKYAFMDYVNPDLNRHDFEASAARLTKPADEMKQYLTQQLYQPCPESDYNEIRLRYLRFHARLLS